MILTIGMIVKNEEKYLHSCLDAISPILQQLDSELIIADTGSTDSTMEIAKAFTDKVFHFEWCDDFSTARNSTLGKAQGEWYMALDADEIFENVSDILEFFHSGEYKRYSSATYIIRSFNNENRSEHVDYNAFRLTKITKIPVIQAGFMKPCLLIHRPKNYLHLQTTMVISVKTTKSLWNKKHKET